MENLRIKLVQNSGVVRRKPHGLSAVWLLGGFTEGHAQVDASASVVEQQRYDLDALLLPLPLYFQRLYLVQKALPPPGREPDKRWKGLLSSRSTSRPR